MKFKFKTSSMSKKQCNHLTCFGFADWACFGFADWAVTDDRCYITLPACYTSDYYNCYHCSNSPRRRLSSTMMTHYYYYNNPPMTLAYDTLATADEVFDDADKTDEVEDEEHFLLMSYNYCYYYYCCYRCCYSVSGAASLTQERVLRYYCRYLWYLLRLLRWYYYTQSNAIIYTIIQKNNSII